ncbi:MAG: hypothetical protein PVS3B3_13820 [Ktedonobacteraceae bacterium]
MAEHLSASAAARTYGINEKTFRKWIRQGVLPAKKVHINGLEQFAISTDDIEAFLAARTATLPGHPDTTISQRLQELEARVQELEHQLHALQQQGVRIAPQREIMPLSPGTQTKSTAVPHSRSEKAQLPEGWAAWNNFLERHGLPPSSFDKKLFITNGREYVLGGVTVKNPLDPEGQVRLLRAGRTRYPGRYRRCEVKDCPCAET